MTFQPIQDEYLSSSHYPSPIFSMKCFFSMQGIFYLHVYQENKPNPSTWLTPLKTNMTLENPPFLLGDTSSFMNHGWFSSQSCLCFFWGGSYSIHGMMPCLSHLPAKTLGTKRRLFLNIWNNSQLHLRRRWRKRRKPPAGAETHVTRSLGKRQICVTHRGYPNSMKNLL